MPGRLSADYVVPKACVLLVSFELGVQVKPRTPCVSRVSTFCRAHGIDVQA